jgi:nickel transport protein
VIPTRPWLLAIALSITLVAVPPARAHELWLDRDGGELVLRYGHSGAVHAGIDALAYPREHVLRVDGFDADGTPLAATVSDTTPVRIAGPGAVTCVLFSSGYWSETPFGTRNLPKDEAKAPSRSWRSLESVKRIDAWRPALARPLTADLELVPLEDPLVLGEGDKVRLLVTLGGEPVADAVVTYDGRERGATDRDGRINIRVRHGGLQFIQAGLTLPGDGVRCDEVVHVATLVFEIR